MFKVTKVAANRVDIELDGKLDTEGMRTALDDLIAKSEDITNGLMLYTMREFSMPSLGAIGVELQRLPKMFGLLGKFDRCAFLCDENWLRTAAEIEGALFPGIEIKSFMLNETDAAEAWLAES